MAEKKRTTAAPKAAHTIKVGDVAAEIYLRQSNTGFPYYDFQLTRKWKSMSSQKQVSGSSFFNVHQEDLTKAVAQASNWISQKMTATPGAIQ